MNTIFIIACTLKRYFFAHNTSFTQCVKLCGDCGKSFTYNRRIGVYKKILPRLVRNA